MTSEEQGQNGQDSRDREAVANFAHETLQASLHRAVDGVLSARFQDQRIRDALTVELFRAIDPIVSDYVIGDRISRMLPAVDSSVPSVAPRSIEDAMATLKAKLQAAFTERQPGSRENRGSMRERASNAMSLAPSVVDSLKTFVHDAAAFERAQQAAVAVMTRYMHPFLASQVVSFAAAAVRGASQARVEGEDGMPGQAEGQPPATEPEAAGSSSAEEA